MRTLSKRIRLAFGQSVRIYTHVGSLSSLTVDLLSIRSGVRIPSGSPYKLPETIRQRSTSRCCHRLIGLVDFGVIWGRLERNIRPEFGQSLRPISTAIPTRLCGAHPSSSYRLDDRASCVRSDSVRKGSPRRQLKDVIQRRMQRQGDHLSCRRGSQILNSQTQRGIYGAL
jgi:hypothetical protein